VAAIDFVGELGAEHGALFALLLERRPRWLLLLLYLRRRPGLTLREAQRLLGMRHGSLRRALRYLAGQPEPGSGRELLASTVGRPLVAVEMLGYGEKLLVLTERGREFADRVLELLRRVALELGRVDVEAELGVSRQEVERYAASALRQPSGAADRVVDWQRLSEALPRLHPNLPAVLTPETLGAVPIEVETPSGRRTLYIIP